MSASRFGNRFVVQSFGESHGPGLGVVIDGCPAGLSFDQELLALQMRRRRPGHSALVSARQEIDQVEVLSGVWEGRTLGTPIAMLTRNVDAKSEDYKNLAPRTGHGDDVWLQKFGHVDPRGGGRSSGRETLSRVMAGSVARMMLQQVWPGFRLRGYATQIGPLSLPANEEQDFLASPKDADEFAARMPSLSQQVNVTDLLTKAQTDGESWGGAVRLVVEGVPAGLGQPVFHKLKADFASAMMSIGATQSFQLAEGEVASRPGTEFHSGKNYGGIRAGISTGERLSMTIEFKPTSSILDVAKKGRHDPCIVVRAIPVVEAMAALVLADHYLWSRTDRI